MLPKFSRKAFALVILLLGLWLGLRYVLPLALPFLLAGVLALISEPLVRVFENRLHLRRGIAAGIGVGISILLAALILITLCAFLLRQLSHLADVVPDLESTATNGIASLESFFLSMAGKAPRGIRPLLTHGVENVFSGSSRMMDQISEKLLNLASGILKALPDSALGLGTWILASFMTSAKLPQIKSYLASHIPSQWKEQTLPRLRHLKGCLGAWLIAQAKLTGVTLCVLAVGFLLLRIPYALLWAAVISLVDALPILGTGTVLIPWSLVCFLRGDSLQALGLLGIYAAAALLRSILEPRLVGKQLGLDPLVTLMALYAGYHLWGIFGMLIAPLLAVTVTQLAWKSASDN
ncbi:MAG: sporulation integral membrane protein YtvI [Ruminococcaceae bacterium]|nr:sporulation integral membrane protein YtvI [Oscillospiraceae bacterium]